MTTPRIRLLLAQRLRLLRKQRKLTQERLSILAGLDRRYYQKLESKKPGAAKIDTIERLAQAFNITSSKLLDFRPSKAITTYPN